MSKSAEDIAEIALRAIVALGPDVFRIVTAADGKERLAATVRLGREADRVALDEARHEVDTAVSRLPHRDGSNPTSGR